MKIYRFATMNEANMFLKEQKRKWLFWKKEIDIRIILSGIKCETIYVIVKNE